MIFEYAVRNIVGFLLQLLPLSALCIAPFKNRLKPGLHRFISIVGFTFAVTLIPFTIVGSIPLGPLDDWRIFIQNIIFIAETAVLFGLYVFSVDATAAQKTFTFLMVIFYGYVITQTQDTVTVLFIDDTWDGHLYAARFLVLTALLYAVSFVPMLHLTKYLRNQLDMVDDRTWWLMCVPSAVLIAFLLCAFWLPLTVVDPYTSLAFLTLANSFYLLFQFWWVLKTARSATDDAVKRTELEAALRQSIVEQQKLNEKLAHEQERLRQLAEQTNGADTRGAGAVHDSSNASGSPKHAAAAGPIVLATANQAVSFRAEDALYIESLNRSRIIHLAKGETITTSLPLASIIDELPAGQFAYCHRSIVVNLACVREVTRTVVTLSDGSEIPASRRRYQELLDALASYSA